MVLGPKEEVVNPAIGKCGGSLQHTEAMVMEQTAFIKTQRGNRRRQIKEVSQLEKSVEPAAKEKEGGTKRLRSEISIPSPKTTGLPKKQQTVDRELSFSHAIKAVKMAIVKEVFPFDRLSNDEFDHVQMEIQSRTDMISLEDHMPKILRSSLQAGAVIIQCGDDETDNWLKGSFQDNKEVISDIELKVMSESDLPKPVKVAFKMKDTYTKEPTVLLKRPNRLNPELKSEG